ncbi:hypothetical protein [Novipirellula artificiosorum]|uniref:DUF2007 domain-containing protein n=1 Tax=Novipirellula artificiosorum TaxID=2528016 RepID=A0A5C6CTX2_9BACT|nr:hypothetical protein [Novipirellula artificiosorum]TWU27942.1 hypothetical protein Poly41_70160 [Novipirellula artificiosorum]
MTLPAPTVVYRSRNYQNAESFAAFIQASGINARLVSPRQIGHMGEGPVFDVLHDVCAVDCTQAEVQRLIAQWRVENDATVSSDVPFCHHCGETLVSECPACPSCGNSLDVDANETIQNGR